MLNAEIGQIIYDARTKAGLTQRQLANRLGTTQSVISRLENADYEGHSLSMLQRVAEVLGQKLELKLSAAA
ncbi:MAG: helix-turn-helix transcriptional regulator [Thermodesulfobacteriota bacterium]